MGRGLRSGTGFGSGPGAGSCGSSPTVTIRHNLSLLPETEPLTVSVEFPRRSLLNSLPDAYKPFLAVCARMEVFKTG